MKTNTSTEPQPTEPEAASATGPELRTAKRVRHQLGDISDPTLWRRVNDSTLNFPPPIKILGRNYFIGHSIDKWIEDRMEAGRNLSPDKLTGCFGKEGVSDPPYVKTKKPVKAGRSEAA